jgi:2-methylfumaryl-CoA isomerase
VALAVMGHLGFIAEAQLGQQRERAGNYLYGAFGRDFVCADGERVMIVGLTQKQWRALCDAMHLSEAMSHLSTELGLNLDEEATAFARASALPI